MAKSEYLKKLNNMKVYDVEAHEALGNVYTKTEIDNKGYLTEHQDISNLALKSEIPTVPSNVSELTNDAGYLTEHQSLAGYYTKTEIDTMIGDIDSALDDLGV